MEFYIYDRRSRIRVIYFWEVHGLTTIAFVTEGRRVDLAGCNSNESIPRWGDYGILSRTVSRAVKMLKRGHRKSSLMDECCFCVNEFGEYVLKRSVGFWFLYDLFRNEIDPGQIRYPMIPLQRHPAAMVASRTCGGLYQIASVRLMCPMCEEDEEDELIGGTVKWPISVKLKLYTQLPNGVVRIHSVDQYPFSCRYSTMRRIIETPDAIVYLWEQCDKLIRDTNRAMIVEYESIKGPGILKRV